MSIPGNKSLRVRSACAVLLAVLAAPVQADSVTVVVGSSTSFNITNIAGSSSASPTVTVSYSSASLASGNRLQISVKANSANFSTTKGSSIAANKVSWTVSGSSGGGSGFSGTLSSTSWTPVFITNRNPTSGSVSLQFSLGAPGSGIKAVTQTLGLQWQLSSTSSSN
jgi:hypothetical protein